MTNARKRVSAKVLFYLGLITICMNIGAEVALRSSDLIVNLYFTTGAVAGLILALAGMRMYVNLPNDDDTANPNQQQGIIIHGLELSISSVQQQPQPTFTFAGPAFNQPAENTREQVPLLLNPPPAAGFQPNLSLPTAQLPGVPSPSSSPPSNHLSNTPR